MSMQAAVAELRHAHHGSPASLVSAIVLHLLQGRRLQAGHSKVPRSCRRRWPTGALLCVLLA